MKSKDSVLEYTDEAGISVPDDQERNFAKCPFCDSDNVCWNGLHAFGGNRKVYEAANPYMPPNELPNWSHECLDCSGVFMSMEKVLNGKPYADLIPKEWDRKEWDRNVDKEG